MGLRRKQQPLPEIPRPEGCAAQLRLIAVDRHITRKDGEQALDGRHLVAILACAGFCERGQDPSALEPVPLASMDVKGDGAGGVGNPSRRGWALALQGIVTLAAQQAELVCATCPSSVLKDMQALRQAELRTRIAEEMEKRALAAKAASELFAQSNPDVRALLGMPEPVAEAVVPSDPPN